jgi:hypothetical protein
MEFVSSHATSDSIEGTPLRYAGRSHSFPKGRVCSAQGCPTVLSRYNGTERCSLHSHLY